MRTAVVLFNIGGPDSPDAVKPFLKNFFSDPAIISLPQPLRSIVAAILAQKRLGKSLDIYEKLGGNSPLLEGTEAQAKALERALSKRGEYKVFVAMRYWHPFIAETAARVKSYDPQKIILLPLYPQFSSTTTESAFGAWYEEAAKQEIDAIQQPVCCYPADNHFIDAHVALIKPAFQEAMKYGKPRVLFSAHSLPEKIIERGDPYQWQIERTAASIMRKFEATDSVVCYQSRLGPRWLKPSVQDEIRRAGKEALPVVVVPVSFVSEHSETLVELNIECRTLAKKSGVPFYIRTPALGTHPEFIRALAWLCDATNLYPNCTNSLGHLCPMEFGECGFREWNNDVRKRA